MRFPGHAAISAIVIMAAAVASAQQKFPLRPGEWEASTPSTPGAAPIMLLYCLNNETWTKALTQNPICTIQQFTVNSSGASYLLDCPSKAFQMKGKVTMRFDGMTHIVGKSSMDATVDGKTTHYDSQTNYVWKNATCSPNDMNLRALKKQ